MQRVQKVQKVQGVQRVHGESVSCKRCSNTGNDQFHRVDGFERIALADDPADPNCGHYYVETVFVMRCTACGHQQETVAKRWPFKTLREAEKELDSRIIGKG